MEKKCYLVCFDLCNPCKDYSDFLNKLKSYSGYGKITEGTWAIISSLKAYQLRDALRPCLSSGDRLIVIRSGKEGAWSNCITSNEWLKSNLIK